MSPIVRRRRELLRTVLVLALTLLGVCSAIVVVGRLQAEATASRDAELKLNGLRLDIAQVQDVPWDASPDEGGDPEAVRVELQRAQKKIAGTLSDLSRDGDLPEQDAISGPFERSMSALWQIFDLMAQNKGDETGDASTEAAEQMYAADAALLKAAKRYRERSADVLTQSRLGSAGVILLLFGAFAWFYARAARGRRTAEALADENRRLLVASREEAAERERMELELRLAQKLEAVGQLAAGIAHEINTPIQFVGDTGRFLDDAVGDLMTLVESYHELHAAARHGTVTPELLARVSAAEENADLEYLRERIPAAFERSFDGIGRVTSIVSAMRSFAHPPTLETCPVDLNEAIRTTLVVAANEYKYIADVETDFGELPNVNCNPGDINQVLLNLIVNAAHAVADVVGDTGERGAIRIRTRHDGEHVSFSITDSGCGIPAEIADRVFDPFFTTKQVGRGTGQGLAIARTIVTERHDGVITFESEPGAGTTFHVRLPVGDSAERNTARATPVTA